jgi:CheY-like chemotaxis protein
LLQQYQIEQLISWHSLRPHFGLNQSEDTDSIPFILCTATPPKNLNLVDFQHEGREILKKPFEVSELLHFVKRYVL